MAVTAVLLTAALLAGAPAVGAQGWLLPVRGEVVRGFDYARERAFKAGSHRGADLAAPPGTLVLAACCGLVVHAGPVAAIGRVVTVRCGARNVTYLPLATLAVRRGVLVRRGGSIGTVAAGHGGLHLGVRRAADRFAYEDPLARMGRELPPPLVRTSRRIRRPPTARPVPAFRRTPSARSTIEPAGPPLGLEPAGGSNAHAEPPSSLPARRRAVLPAGAQSEALERPIVDRRPAVALAGHPTTAPVIVWAGAAFMALGCAGSCTIALNRRRRPEIRASARAGTAG